MSNPNSNGESAPGPGAGQFKVVLNHEEQYSIWPAERDNPLGWKDAGVSGSKEECLAAISERWTDMRPLSLRQAMDEDSGSR